MEKLSVINVLELYRHVIQDVVDNVRKDFAREGKGDVLDKLQSVCINNSFPDCKQWETKLIQSGVLRNVTREKEVKPKTTIQKIDRSLNVNSSSKGSELNTVIRTPLPQPFLMLP